MKQDEIPHGYLTAILDAMCLFVTNLSDSLIICSLLSTIMFNQTLAPSIRDTAVKAGGTSVSTSSLYNYFLIETTKGSKT